MGQFTLFVSTRKKLDLTIVDRALAYQSLIMCVVIHDNKQNFLNICMKKKEKPTLPMES
jgi:hypothetical protein